MKTPIPCLALLTLAGTAFAGQTVVSKNVVDKNYVTPEIFQAHELQLDLFGLYTDGNGLDHAGNIQEHGWGGGLGLNYFFTRNLGLGLEASYLSAKEASYVRHSSGRQDIYNFNASLIYRFPIESMRSAPYVFLGGGASIDGDQWGSGHAGLGWEYRPKDKLGIFTDVRYTYFGDRFGRGDHGNASARVGLRIVF